MGDKCLCKHSSYCGSIVFKEDNYYRYLKRQFKYVVFDENEMPYTFTEMVFKSLFETNKSILRNEIINEILK